MDHEKNQDLTPEIMQRALQQIMRERGSARSAKKAAAAAENGKRGGRPVCAIEELDCTCSAAETENSHKAGCPRGRAIKRRQAAK